MRIYTLVTDGYQVEVSRSAHKAIARAYDLACLTPTKEDLKRGADELLRRNEVCVPPRGEGDWLVKIESQLV